MSNKIIKINEKMKTISEELKKLEPIIAESDDIELESKKSKLFWEWVELSDAFDKEFLK